MAKLPKPLVLSFLARIVRRRREAEKRRRKPRIVPPTRPREV